MNHKGSGGKSFQDRTLSAKVRTLALDKIRIILERPTVEMSERDKELHDAILVRMSSTLLPRLNAGRDDGERMIPEPIYSTKKVMSEKNTPLNVILPHYSDEKDNEAD